MTTNIEAAKQALAHIEQIQSAKQIRTFSRDFFWYSPILKEQLDGRVADFVVCPRNEQEVIDVLRVCYHYDIPVTTRGSGTGNYGQSIPLRGGCVMLMRHVNQIKAISPGRVVVEPGCLLKNIDAACVEHSSQELRMFPSTWSTASIGGFIAGGSCGVGSITWGSLRDPGNILKLRIVTMEETPKIVELTGESLTDIAHAYGTNGIITEIDMPLAPAYDWVDIMLTSRDYSAALTFIDQLGNEDGILLKLASAYEAPTAKHFFPKVSPQVDEHDHLMSVMVAPHSLDALLTLLGRHSDITLIYRSDQTQWPEPPGKVFEYAWNHTTLRALQQDRSVTYLQVGYGYPDHISLAEQICKAFPGEVIQHIEAMRVGGKVSFTGLPLIKYTTEQRLQEIIDAHEDAGIPVYNPHRYTIEEGGRNQPDIAQLNLKKTNDPKGLLNPGKMLTWHSPDWRYDKMYDFHQDQSK